MRYPVHFDITNDPKWKYKTLKTYTIKVLWISSLLKNPEELGKATSGYITFNKKTNILKINKGYSWDGPSGPALDTARFMIPSLFHDALYQLIKERLLPGQSRKESDLVLLKVCIDQGMNKVIAYVVYYIVRLFGGFVILLDRLRKRNIFKI